MSILFQNFMAASRKRNLARFRLFSNQQDTGFIDNAPLDPLTFVSATFASNLHIDTATANVITIPLTGNVTSSSLNYNGGIPVTGIQVYLRIVQDAVGGRTFAFPPTLTIDPTFTIDPNPNTVTVVPIMYNGTSWETFEIPFSFHL